MKMVRVIIIFSIKSMRVIMYYFFINKHDDVPYKANESGDAAKCLIKSELHSFIIIMRYY